MNSVAIAKKELKKKKKKFVTSVRHLDLAVLGRAGGSGVMHAVPQVVGVVEGYLAGIQMEQRYRVVGGFGLVPRHVVDCTGWGLQQRWGLVGAIEDMCASLAEEQQAAAEAALEEGEIAAEAEAAVEQPAVEEAEAVAAADAVAEEAGPVVQVAEQAGAVGAVGAAAGQQEQKYAALRAHVACMYHICFPATRGGV